MDLKNISVYILTIKLVLINATIISFTLLNSNVFSQDEIFNTKLSGQAVVPPTDAHEAGLAEFTSMNNSFKYSVNVTNIEDITAGHIHLGKQEDNGQVVVTLFEFDSPQSVVSQSGTITSDKLEGPMQGKQIIDLAAAMTNGSTYVDVHTKENINGKVRGQINNMN